MTQGAIDEVGLDDRAARPWARLGVGVCLVLALVAVGLVYAVAGWHRMEWACGADPPGTPPPRGTVQMGWSWWPPGFECSYADGTVRRELWF